MTILDQFNKNRKVQILLVVLILLLINFIVFYLYGRFDCTSEKRYSLASSTEKLMENQKSQVYVKVYLDGDLPAGFLRLKNATKDLLKEFKTSSTARFTYEFINPIAKATTDEDKLRIYQELSARGLLATNLKLKTNEGLTEKIIFPCLEVIVDGKPKVVQMLENQLGYTAEENLNNSIISMEYKIANAIKSLEYKESFQVYFLQGQGEYVPVQLESLKSLLLANNISLTPLDISGNIEDSALVWVPKDADLLIIARPFGKFSEQIKYKIDQYIMNGGKVLWALDGVDAKMEYLRNKDNTFTAKAINLGLEDMLFTYGVRVNQNLIQDAQQSAPIPIMDEKTNKPMLFPWLYSPLLTPSDKHPISKNLDPILANFSSSIDTISENGIKKTTLLHTSNYGKAIPEPVRVHLSMVGKEPNFKNFKQANIPVAMLLEGEFTSPYKNRLKGEFIKSMKTLGYEPKVSSPSTKMIVISDADIVRNEISAKGEIYPLGYEPYSKQTFANQYFVLNCIEYLVDNNNLLDARNKEIKVRLLDANRVQTEATKWRIINILIPILAVIVFSIIYRYIRRRKWTDIE